MWAARILALLVIGLVITISAVSAQPGLPPGVKLPPQIKPGNPPKVPGVPKGVDPKGKNPPGVPVPPGMPPGLPPGVGLPPGTPGVPADKKDNIKWPTEINGKSLEQTVKDMRSHPDPAIREAAVRALPGFGPKGRDLGAGELVEAMTRDGDWNVRLAGVAVAPTVLLFYATAPDAALTNGLTAITNMLSSDLMHVRYDAVLACAAVGPFMRTAQLTIIQKLTSRARETNSWQMRRAATAAIGVVGNGLNPGDSPDPAAVTALLDILKSDNCAPVRREAVNSLIVVGPVAPAQQKTWRTATDNVLKLGLEKDKSVLLWVRVLIIRNSPDGLKGNEAHLDAIARVLEVPEPAGRLEACQALGTLGEEAKSKLQNLIDVINNAKEEPLIVAAAIMALTEMPSKDMVTVPILNNVKTMHKNEDVKKVATEAIDILTGKKKKN